MKTTSSICIVSIKFAPGLFKEFVFIGENLARSGITPYYLLSEGYRDIAGPDFKGNYVPAAKNIQQILVDSLFPWRILASFLKVLKSIKPSVVYFYNTHPVEILLALVAHALLPKCVLIFHLHEPHQPDKSFFTLQQKFIVNIQEFINRCIVSQCDHVVVPSPHAETMFRKHYPVKNKIVHFAPLMIPDEPAVSSGREYALMAGRIYPDGRWSDFIKVVNYAADKNSAFKFRLLTSSVISNEMLIGLSNKGRALLHIVSKRPLSDGEINQNMSNAFALLSMHPRGSQSGVTPVAFMNSTPIVARDIPMFSQFVKSGVNGILVSPNADPKDWVDALEKVQISCTALSAQARKSFDDIFHEKNWVLHFGWLTDIFSGIGPRE